MPNGNLDLWGTLEINVGDGQSFTLQGATYGMTGLPDNIGTTLVAHGSGTAVNVIGLQGLYSGQLSFRDFRVEGNVGTTALFLCNLCQLLEFDNIILDSAGAEYAPGLACAGCVFATIKRSQFINNTGIGAEFIQSGNGGGVYTFEADRFLDNCQFTGNLACAGLYINAAYTVDIGGTTFEGVE